MVMNVVEETHMLLLIHFIKKNTIFWQVPASSELSPGDRAKSKWCIPLPRRPYRLQPGWFCYTSVVLRRHSMSRDPRYCLLLEVSSPASTAGPNLPAPGNRRVQVALTSATFLTHVLWKACMAVQKLLKICNLAQFLPRFLMCLNLRLKGQVLGSFYFP